MLVVVLVAAILAVAALLVVVIGTGTGYCHMWATVLLVIMVTHVIYKSLRGTFVFSVAYIKLPSGMFWLLFKKNAFKVEMQAHRLLGVYCSTSLHVIGSNEEDTLQCLISISVVSYYKARVNG